MTPAPLLFDMDGLLLDTERVAMRAFCDLAVPAGLGLEVAEAAFLALIGSSRQQTQARLHEVLPLGTDIADFEQRWTAHFYALKSDNGIPFLPFAREVVVALAEAGHPMAIVTSTHGKAARKHLEDVGLAPFFSHLIAGDEVTDNKPHPAPYLAGAAALGVAPVTCFAFEDSDTGTTSAHRAGCRVVQIPDLRPPGKALPDLGQMVARDLNEAVQMTGLLPKGV